MALEQLSSRAEYAENLFLQAIINRDAWTALLADAAISGNPMSSEEIDNLGTRLHARIQLASLSGKNPQDVLPEFFGLIQDAEVA